MSLSGKNCKVLGGVSGASPSFAGVSEEGRAAVISLRQDETRGNLGGGFEWKEKTGGGGTPSGRGASGGPLTGWRVADSGKKG